MEIDEVGVGQVVAGQQSLLGQPETVVATQDSLELFTVVGQNAGCNAEIREWIRGEVVEDEVGCNRSSHTVTAEDDDLLQLRVVDGLSCEKGSAERS
jgi:hypothetical protein